MATEKEINTDCNKLGNRWVLWTHFPHDTDWSIKSYKVISKFDTVESVIAITESLPEKLIKNCMLFLMKEGIQPIWEDPLNRNGGCFSYKAHNKDVINDWKNFTYVVTGESLTNNKNLLDSVNGITISPKKNFCIIKMWLSNCEYQNPHLLSVIPNIDTKGILFKKQTPEY